MGVITQQESEGPNSSVFNPLFFPMELVYSTKLSPPEGTRNDRRQIFNFLLHLLFLAHPVSTKGLTLAIHRSVPVLIQILC